MIITYLLTAFLIEYQQIKLKVTRTKTIVIMDYKEKVIALLNSQELSKEQKEKVENIFPELKESEDERIRKELIEQVAYITPNNDELDDVLNTLPTYQKRIDKYRAWLEKQDKKLDADRVIAWLVANICDFEYYVKLFKKDFKL